MKDPMMLYLIPEKEILLLFNKKNMTNNKKKALKYGTTVYAAIILIAILVATFIYSLINAKPDNVDDYVIETSNGSLGIDPGAGPFPTEAPNVSPPTTPPNGN